MEPGGMEGDEKRTLGSVVQIDEGKIQAHLDQGCEPEWERLWSALLDDEADRLCGARKSERPTRNWWADRLIVVLSLCVDFDRRYDPAIFNQ
jgi:hypothetical protein